MKTRSIVFALLGGLLLALPAGASNVQAPPPAQAPVDDEAFSAQAHVIEQEMKLTEEAGLFGRPGSTPGAEGPASYAVGDRDLDRYVQRLAAEIRLRNEMADRDPEGFR